MTIGDWLGLICLAGLIGFFSGGFFVWQLFFKKDRGEDNQNDDDSDEEAVQNEEDAKRLD